MAQKLTKQELAIRRKALLQVGTGLLTAGGLLGFTIYLIQRQAQKGDFLRVRLLHEVDPETRGLLASYTPIMDRISQDGIRLRLGRPRSSSSSTSTD
jgi:hypothetical protein